MHASLSKCLLSHVFPSSIVFLFPWQSLASLKSPSLPFINARLDNRAVLRLSWLSNIYILWHFGAQKGQRLRRKTRIERERDAYQRNKGRHGKTDKSEEVGQRKGQTERVKLRTDTHRQTKGL